MKANSNTNRVQAVRSAHNRRAERQLEQALLHPEKVEDWEELDYTVQESITHKHDLE